jgi:hypothetical protein
MTDPAIVNITEFNIDDSNSKTAGLLEEDGSTLNQSMREIEIRVTGELVRDNTINREIHDTIRVRNDFLWKSLCLTKPTEPGINRKKPCETSSIEIQRTASGSKAPSPCSARC